MDWNLAFVLMGKTGPLRGSDEGGGEADLSLETERAAEMVDMLTSDSLLPAINMPMLSSLPLLGASHCGRSDPGERELLLL